ncbi:hypothetical protein [Dyella japonica]|uniref:hypothetical protein n=1 Tax=Dyella japonica TaxID=231455 RepID=UPI000A98F749|nr:hypothetical protein [Dyella japonica]
MMSTFRKVFAALALVSPVCAFAGSVFDGTWKTDLSQTQESKKPYEFVLQNGMFDCKTCVPPYTIKADGKDQPVQGNPYFDTVAVEVVDAHTIKTTYKKAGKVTETMSAVLAADGKTGRNEYIDSTGSGAPVTGSYEFVRVAPGPAGSHAWSGKWQISKALHVSDNGTTWTWKEADGMLSFSMPNGQSYSAKIDGTEAPFQGDPGVTSVKVKVAGNTLEESDLRNGKVITVMTATVSADGKTLKVVTEDKLRNRTTSWVANKQ